MASARSQIPNGIYPYLYQIAGAEVELIPLGASEIKWDGITVLYVFSSHTPCCGPQLGLRRQFASGVLFVVSHPCIQGDSDEPQS
jgi:hypothetical protein